jgi:predicted dithiol-disulfide oxidoreductase (DUF899 family)
MPGISAFYKNSKGEIYHTYSAYARTRHGQWCVSMAGSNAERAG